MSELYTIYVILPVYNSEQFLRRSLDSLKNQTYKKFVCVIVDDGSKDSSNIICKSYTSDERFILLEQKNHGSGHARNTGLDYVFEHAEANSFLTFVDADDTIKPDFFENFIIVLKNYGDLPEDTIYLSGYNEILPEKKIIHKFENLPPIVTGDFRENFESLDPYMQTIWGNFYNIKLMKEKKLKFNSTYKRSEDVFFNFTYAPFIKKFVFINDCFYNYYVISNSTSHNPQHFTEESFNLKCMAFEKRLTFLTECNIKNKNFIINKHLSNLVFRHILVSQYKYLYRLRKYAEPKYGRTGGQKRVIFCLKYRLLWLYRLYLRLKTLSR